MDGSYARTPGRIRYRDPPQPGAPRRASDLVCLARLGTAGAGGGLHPTHTATDNYPSPGATHLTVWVSAHASARGIQTCLRTLTEQGISLATITAILHTAQQRAIAWMQSH